MATFVLVPGAGSDPSYWNPLSAELSRRGHAAIAVDLPCEDDAAGLEEYATTIVSAIGDHRDVVLVAHSLGAFSATLVPDRVPVDLLVLVAAMVPAPGESGMEWWSSTGQQAAFDHEVARLDFDRNDDNAYFYNDVPASIVSEQLDRGQSSTPMDEPWPLSALPDVPTRCVLFRDDRLFPAEFIRQLAQDRLAVVPDEAPGGHMAMLSHPRELADVLESYV